MTTLSGEFAAVEYAHQTYSVDNANNSKRLLIAQNTLAKCPLFDPNRSLLKIIALSPIASIAYKIIQNHSAYTIMHMRTDENR